MTRDQIIAAVQSVVLEFAGEGRMPKGATATIGPAGAALIADAIETTAMKFPRGTPVYKTKGHEFIGSYLTEFDTIAGERRCVCECTVSGAGGMLYVLRPEQLTEMQTDASTGTA